MPERYHNVLGQPALIAAAVERAQREMERIGPTIERTVREMAHMAPTIERAQREMERIGPTIERTVREMADMAPAIERYVGEVERMAAQASYVAAERIRKAAEFAIEVEMKAPLMVRRPTDLGQQDPQLQRMRNMAARLLSAFGRLLPNWFLSEYGSEFLDDLVELAKDNGGKPWQLVVCAEVLKVVARFSLNRFRGRGNRGALQPRAYGLPGGYSISRDERVPIDPPRKPPQG